MQQAFIAIVLIVISLVMMVLAGCGFAEPGCEERGGERVLSHFSPLFTGKTIVMVPMYRCEGVRP